ncbi:MAG: LamG-like jellyroll fold domain-containing protein, partial [Bacteroidia bacterium]
DAGVNASGTVFTKNITNLSQNEFILGSTGGNSIGEEPDNTLNTEVGSGSCLEFDGSNDQVIIPDHYTIQPSNEFTLEAWVNSHSTNYTKIFSKWDGSYSGTDDGAITFDISSNKVRLAIVKSDDNQWYSSAANTGFASNEWHHIAATFNNGAVKLYVDGIEVVSSTFPETSVENNGFGWGLGEDAAFSQATYFNGYLDEARIWTEALSQSTIQDYMCKKVDGSHPNLNGLGAYYNFENGAKDISGNANHGTQHNGPKQVISDAPIGDASTYDYTITSSSSDLNIAHPNGDDLTIAFASGTADAVHVYSIENAPNYLEAPSGMDKVSGVNHYGLFVSGSSTLNYNVTYNYDGHPNYSSESDLALCSRAGNSTTAWTEESGASLSTSNNTLTLTGETANQQFILGSDQNNELGFYVSSHTPTAAKNYVDTAGNITITFSENVDANSITSSSIKIIGNMGGAKQFTKSVNGAVLTLDPSSDFHPNEEVSVYVYKSVESTNGTKLSKAHVFYYRCNSKAYPEPPLGFIEHSLGTVNGASSMCVGDMDNDGSIDVLARAYEDDKIYANYNGSGNLAQTTFQSIIEPGSVYLADIDSDGDMDAFYSDYSDRG